MSIIYWNIQGLLYVKLYSPEFEERLKYHDIAILVETHLLPDDEECLAVPKGFYAFSVCRKVTGPWERHGGGVTAFVKNNIQAKKSHLSSPDILVLDLGTCWLIGAYIQPERSRWQHYTNTAPEHKLEETIALCATADDTKPLILVLDANARTQSEMAAGDLARLSADHEFHVTTRGHKLLSAWKRSKLVILNGTQLEDVSPGRFTSIKKFGVAEAVVDYAAVSESLISSVRSLSIATPEPPLEAWSDHVSLTLKIDRSVLQIAPRPPKRVRSVPVLLQGDPEMDKLCEDVMNSKKSPAEMLRELYGKVYIQTPWAHVYVQGSCKESGTRNARGVGAVFWGGTSPANIAVPVPGPEPPTSNRAAIYAALLAVKGADPDVSLMIFTHSEYVIRHACYWAGKNMQLGWSSSNGDLLKDLVLLLKGRRAPTRFVRTERNVKNERAAAAKKLAQDSLKNCPCAPDYIPLRASPWGEAEEDQDVIDTSKVSTSLPETTPPKEAGWKLQVDEENNPLENPEHHRGREKVRQLQKSLRDKIFECKDAGAFWRVLRGWTDPRPRPVEVSLEQLTEEFKKRMNEPEEVPPSFNQEQLKIWAELFKDMHTRMQPQERASHGG